MRVSDNTAISMPMRNLISILGAVAVGPKCTYTQDGTKLSSWIWFTKEIPVDLSKDNCN